MRTISIIALLMSLPTTATLAATNDELVFFSNGKDYLSTWDLRKADDPETLLNYAEKIRDPANRLIDRKEAFELLSTIAMKLNDDNSRQRLWNNINQRPGKLGDGIEKRQLLSLIRFIQAPPHKKAESCTETRRKFERSFIKNILGSPEELLVADIHPLNWYARNSEQFMGSPESLVQQCNRVFNGRSKGDTTPIYERAILDAAGDGSGTTGK